ncbi:hypothetical protein QU38_01510, partial [Staphylococcus aureus]
MLDHLGDLMLGAEERAGEIDGDGVVPAGLGDGGGGTGVADDAGIVVGDVEPAVSLDRERDQRPRIVLGAHVAGERHGLAAGGLDLGDEARKLGLAPGADHHLGALRREQFGGGAADAGAGTGDDGDLALKAPVMISVL